MSTVPGADSAARPARSRSARGRRTARPTADEREAAILATAERLLGERPMSEISIDDLARGAGISRPTFYFYFSGKDAVLLALLDRVVEEADAAAWDLLDDLPADPAGRWRAAIDAFYGTFRAHRPVALACAQVRATNPEVGRLWATVLEAWIGRTARAIDSERERGAAPPGLPARDLAVALTCMNERVFHATLAEDHPAIAEPDVVEVLLGVWLSTIYRTAAPPPA